jgi:hypothetical protein
MKKTSSGMSPSDALMLSDLLDQLKGIDLNQTASVMDATPVDRLISDLKNNKTVSRALKGKGRYKANLHWKTKAHRRKAYYAEVGAPRRRRKIAEQLTTAEGWFAYLVTGWKIHRTPFTLTLEEWVTQLYPVTVGRGYVPVFQRYNTRRPVSLDNVIVRDAESREVLFDGAEYSLNKLGYTL